MPSFDLCVWDVIEAVLLGAVRSCAGHVLLQEQSHHGSLESTCKCVAMKSRGYLIGFVVEIS